MNKFTTFAIILAWASCICQGCGNASITHRKTEDKFLSSGSYPDKVAGGDDYLILQGISNDDNYAVNKNHPIKIGGGFPQGDLDIYRYLNGLLGPDSLPIIYSRLGTCCEFQSNPGLMGTGKGALDVYVVRSQDGTVEMKIYFNTFAKGELLAPMGLLYRKPN